MGLHPLPHPDAIAPSVISPGVGSAPPIPTARAAGNAVPRSQPKPVDLIYDQILAQIEPALAVRMTRAELAARVQQLVAEIANQRRLLLNQHEQQTLAAAMV